MPASRVKDPTLVDQGKLKIEWAEAHMPVLVRLRSMYADKKPLDGIKVSAALHVTKETAVLVRTLRDWGARVTLVPSNPLSTQDDVAAALAQEEGVTVIAWRGMSEQEYFSAIAEAARASPDIIIDDGADLHVFIHQSLPEVGKNVIGGNEETTTGVIRLRALEAEGRLLYPVIAVNNALTKYLFDNRYGTGQSTIDGVLRATNLLLAGRRVVVAGYGWVGRGIAMRLRGMGARVIVTEVDPIRALEAVMDGFDVMPMSEAAQIGEVFITATGDRDVITREHMLKMRDGAVLANAGHFNVEVSVSDLESIAVSKREVRPNAVEFRLPDGRRLYLLAEGRLVNLVAAEGHPSEVMDMSFTNQALSVLYHVQNKGKLVPRVYDVPREQDELVARLKLETMGIKIDQLTPAQAEYLRSWR